MKVDIYGISNNQDCQDAVRFLKAAQVEVNFLDLTEEKNKEELIKRTKTANYTLSQATAEGVATPVVISDKTEEIIIGYTPDENTYENILKQASEDKIERFLNTHSEYSRK